MAHAMSDCLFWHPDNPKYVAKLKLEPGFLAWANKGTGKGGKPEDETSDNGEAVH